MVIHRLVPSLLHPTRRMFSTSPIVQSGAWSYRCGPPKPAKFFVVKAEILGGFMWWWVLWHCWTEPGHLFGEFDIPDPSCWSDEELGIPPDEETP